MSCGRLKWQTHGLQRMSGSSCSKTRLEKSSRTFQNIEESRAGIGVAYRRISKNQMIHNDDYQLLQKLIFLVPKPGLDADCRAIPNDLLNTDHQAFKAHTDYIGLNTKLYKKKNFFVSLFNILFSLFINVMCKLQYFLWRLRLNK